MKVTKKQLLLLLRVLEESLNFVGADEIFRYNHKIRNDLYSEILNQQSASLQEVGND